MEYDQVPKCRTENRHKLVMLEKYRDNQGNFQGRSSFEDNACKDPAFIWLLSELDLVWMLLLVFCYCRNITKQSHPSHLSVLLQKHEFFLLLGLWAGWDTADLSWAQLQVYFGPIS